MCAYVNANAPEGAQFPEVSSLLQGALRSNNLRSLRPVTTPRITSNMNTDAGFPERLFKFVDRE